MKPISFKIVARDSDSHARAGILKTKNGSVKTPYLIPVATRARVECLNHEDIKKLKVQCLLANTYHLHLKPGDKKIKKQGGLHKAIPFKGPIFTDSGGFQAFSLGIGREQGARKIGFFPGVRKRHVAPDNKLVKITSKGVWFTSVYDESKHFMGPKESMDIQSNLGADIIMAFDECTSAFASKSEMKKAMERSHKWEKASLEHHDPNQALYGIIHGGWFKDLRVKSTKIISSLPFDGIAVGGSLGRGKDQMSEILSWITPLLDDRPRHMLGIGWIEDLFTCVEKGMDTFDCVETTRLARHGQMYISPSAGGNVKNKFRISIRNTQYKEDGKPVDSFCKCSTCKKYTRKELRKLCKSRDQTYGRLATIHNIAFTQQLAKEIRNSIIKGTFQKLKKEWLTQ